MDVESNPAMFERVKNGMFPQDEVVEDKTRTAEDKLLDETIEHGLLNRVHFAREQFLRTIYCHDYLRSDDEKKSVVREVYQQLEESLNLLKQWGSELTLFAYANDLKFLDMAVRLGSLVGIDLTRLVGRVRAIQRTRPFVYRAKVLGRALHAASTNANSFWMLLSGNVEVAISSTTATTTAATDRLAPASTLSAATASATATSNAATPTAGEKRKARP
jgi:hypothetical protein